MTEHISQFISERINEITMSLPQVSSRYALLLEKQRDLLETVDPIAFSETNITITRGDCDALRELLEIKVDIASVAEKEIYKQGYLDCANILSRLGVI